MNTEQFLYEVTFAPTSEMTDPDRPAFIYVLVDEAGEVRYVGATVGLKARFGAHRGEWRFRKLGEPRMFVVEETTWGKSGEAERTWLEHFMAQGAPLLSTRRRYHRVGDGGHLGRKEEARRHRNG